MKLNNRIFIFEFLLVISFILLPILPIRSQNSFFIFNEMQTKNTNPPIVYNIQSFDDDKIVVHIVHQSLLMIISHVWMLIDIYRFAQFILTEMSYQLMLN